MTMLSQLRCPAPGWRQSHSGRQPGVKMCSPGFRCLRLERLRKHALASRVNPVQPLPTAVDRSCANHEDDQTVWPLAGIKVPSTRSPSRPGPGAHTDRSESDDARMLAHTNRPSVPNSFIAALSIGRQNTCKFRRPPFRAGIFLPRVF